MSYNFVRQKIDVGALPHQVVFKWSESTLEEGFVPVSKKFLRCLHLLFDGEGAKDIAALLAIIDYKRPHLLRPPSSANLAFLAGLSEPEFRSALGRLVAKNLVQILHDNEDKLSINTRPLLQAIERLTAADEGVEST